MLDKDELDEAKYKKVINEEQYNLACNVVKRLMDNILNDRILLFKRYENDFKHLFELVKEKNFDERILILRSKLKNNIYKICYNAKYIVKRM